MIITKTKAATAAEYKRRMNKVLQYIDLNLDQSLQLENIAKASHFSPFHFHRIFHALIGETVNDYVIRRRMEKAAYILVYKPELKIIDVAMESGYSSNANFSKAFKSYFGLSPSMLRKKPTQDTFDKFDSKKGKLFSKYGKALNPQDLYSQFVTKIKVFNFDKLEEMLMNITVKDMPEKGIAYLTTPAGYNLDSVYETWDKLIHWAELRKIDTSHENRFAICHDNPSVTPENLCRYDACIVINSSIDVILPCNRSTIPSGKYAVAYFKDRAEKINNFMTEICSTWLPNSGYEPDDYPVIFNYLNDSRQDGYVEMNVYIKIKELKLTSTI